MKIRIISSREEISTVSPKERHVHLAFFPATQDLYELLDTCPRVESIGVQRSQISRLAKASVNLLERERIKLIEGDGLMQGKHTEKDPYYYIKP